MNVLFVSQYFWPENFRINDLCSEMVKKGCMVTVLTGEPNYPSGIKDEKYLKNKDAYSSYNGCEIIRVPLIARGDGKLRLILNYISYFVFASTIGLWKLRNKKFDVIFVCQLSPVTIALPAIVYRYFYKVPIVMWVLDLWPDSLKAIGVVRNEKVYSLIKKLVQFINNRCDLILGQSNRIVEAVKSNCTSEMNVEFFPSWAEDVFNDIPVHPKNNILGFGFFNILFAGNIGEAQNFPAIFNALDKLKQKGIKVKFHIIGDGRYLQKVKEDISNRDLNDIVKLWGRYPLDSMPSFYASADVLYVSLKDSPAFSMTIPGKVQSYMMAKKPILASLCGEGAEAILGAGCGYVSKPNEYNDLADNIEKMIGLGSEELNRMGEKGKQYADQNFNREILMSKLFNMFKFITKKNNG